MLALWRPLQEGPAPVLQLGQVAAFRIPLALGKAGGTEPRLPQGPLLPEERTRLVEGKRAFPGGVRWAAHQAELHSRLEERARQAN